MKILTVVFMLLFNYLDTLPKRYNIGYSGRQYVIVNFSMAFYTVLNSKHV